MNDSLRVDHVENNSNLRPMSTFIRMTTRTFLISAIVYESVVLLSKAFSLAATWANRPSLANRVSLTFTPPISGIVGSCLILGFALLVTLIKHVKSPTELIGDNLTDDEKVVFNELQETVQGSIDNLSKGIALYTFDMSPYHKINEINRNNILKALKECYPNIKISYESKQNEFFWTPKK